MSVTGRRVLFALPAVVLVAVLLAGAFPSHHVYADQITDRSLTLMTGPTGDGGSKPGGVVDHSFTFSVPSPDAVGSIRFLYCTTATGNDGNPDDDCTAPTGLSVSAATLGASSGGAVFTNATATSANSIYVSRAAAAAPSGTPITVQLNSVTNPHIDPITAANASITFFVRISTYGSTDASGAAIDTGTVTSSTANQIVLTGIMPESLIFCTGGTIDVNTNDIPQCSTATSGSIMFNQLFSPQSTSWATSQMAASTNADQGYVITTSGPTLTSGSNTIPAIGATAAASSPGSGQFGMNVVDDSTDPTIGSSSTNPITYYTDPAGHTGGDIFPAANGTNYRGQAKANFDTAASFAFNASGTNVVAASDHTSAGPTDSQRFTSTYIVNVSGSQPAGTYVTTLTYICTPTF